MGKNGWSKGDKKKEREKGTRQEGREKEKRERGRRCKLRKEDRERERETAAHSVSIPGPEEKHATINSFIPAERPQQI